MHISWKCAQIWILIELETTQEYLTLLTETNKKRLKILLIKYILYRFSVTMNDVFKRKTHFSWQRHYIQWTIFNLSCASFYSHSFVGHIWHLWDHCDSTVGWECMCLNSAWPPNMSSFDKPITVCGNNRVCGNKEVEYSTGVNMLCLFAVLLKTIL